MAEGWIRLLRKIQDHWIWQDEKKLKWWISILLNVNHASQKFAVGDELFLCESGQSFRSIEQWTAMFSCSKKTTIKFFRIAKKRRYDFMRNSRKWKPKETPTNSN